MSLLMPFYPAHCHPRMPELLDFLAVIQSPFLLSVFTIQKHIYIVPLFCDLEITDYCSYTAQARQKTFAYHR